MSKQRKHVISIPDWVVDPVRRAMGAQAEIDYANEGGLFRERLTRCYELASLGMVPWEGMAEHLESEGLPTPDRLVHGSWHGPEAPKRIKHAWVMLDDGRVWEPITSLIYDRDKFYSYTRAQDDRLYSRAGALRRMNESQHHGPWDE